MLQPCWMGAALAASERALQAPDQGCMWGATDQHASEASPASWQPQHKSPQSGGSHICSSHVRWAPAIVPLGCLKTWSRAARGVCPVAREGYFSGVSTKATTAAVTESDITASGATK